MSKRNDFIWKAIKVVFWLIFLGFCVQTGALLFNYIFSLFKPIATNNLHLGLNLSELYSDSKSTYGFAMISIIAISAFKAYLFFVVIKLLNKLNLVKPFSSEVLAIISKITYFTFIVGIINLIVLAIFSRLSENGFKVVQASRYCNDGDAYILMSAILFVIVLIFKKGIELQNENDLTI